MRIGRGCERCRLRHIKCTIAPAASSCNECTRLSRVCCLDPPFRFKAVRHVYQKSQGTASRFELAWDAQQPWVKVPRSLIFVEESTEDPDSDGIPETQIEHQLAPSAIPEFPQFRAPATPSPREQITTPAYHDQVIASLSGSSPGPHRTISSIGISPKPMSGPSPLASVNTWAGISPSLSPASLQQGVSPSMTTREASLLRSFIHSLAPRFDICDLHSHFSSEVPRRALQNPMVLKALLALSARHDAIISRSNDWEASEYHSQCVELLIGVLSKPEETYDDDLLITVVILRVYEELERVTDEKCHWLGSTRLLNTMARSASSGGLAEAVSWQFLRQAIYACLVEFQPMHLNLDNYEHSSVFRRRDDAAYANSIIFLCAKIVQLRSGPNIRGFDPKVWQYLSDSVDQWYHQRPISWQPLKFKEADPAENRPFPELWMVSPPAVVGLQYYHTSRIILATSNEHRGIVSDYELARSRRLEEQIIATHLINVIGLSKSNETVDNAYFMCCHLLSRYGFCLRHTAERQGSLDFLSLVEKQIGWPTSRIVTQLEDEWRELHSLDAWSDR
ncbi:hypothetical protein BJX99DRAFT_267827 [Aspergillus californicus]